MHTVHVAFTYLLIGPTQIILWMPCIPHDTMCDWTVELKRLLNTPTDLTPSLVRVYVCGVAPSTADEPTYGVR